MRMSRLNIYVPDELAERARAAGLNVSALAQAAIRDELDRDAGQAWLADLPADRVRLSHGDAQAALDGSREESDDLP